LSPCAIEQTGLRIEHVLLLFPPPQLMCVAVARQRSAGSGAKQRLQRETAGAALRLAV